MPRSHEPRASGDRPGRQAPRVPIHDLGAGRRLLSAEQAHYLDHVRRLTVGNTLRLFDAAGREATATITRCGRDAIEVDVGPVAAARTIPCGLSVALACPKGERAAWAVEKLTEVGVARILWVSCEHSVVKPEGSERQLQRWQRLAEAAAAQSARVGWPEVVGPIPFEQFLTLRAETRLIADMSGAPIAVSAATPSALLGIGPEGGFTAAELDRARAAGFAAVSLSSNILRVETAAVVGAAMILGTARGTT